MREPCSHLHLSAWGWMREGRNLGPYSKMSAENRSLYFHKYGPDVTGVPLEPGDRDAFRRRMRSPGTLGLPTHLFHRNYRDMPALDCWVRTANLVADATTCLHTLELQGGYVNWQHRNEILYRSSTTKKLPPVQ